MIENNKIPYQGARYYKCALQVNPCSYAGDYRGAPGQDEDAYNAEILAQCQKNGIEVVGLANHGDVDSSEKLRHFLSANGIVVFPGFEIASSEKIHFVCLFDENIERDDLIGYLVELGVDRNNPGKPSTFSAHQLLERTDALGGAIYAAHCTNTSGVLKERHNNIWQNKLLKIAQIPGSVDDLKGADGDFYHKVFMRKESNYEKDSAVAIINAKDVCQPEQLNDLSASCLVKMTAPNFSAFKQAFLDPDSRIRLNHQIPQPQYSFIRSVEWGGAGFLGDSRVAFSQHLNTIIGGRGTGKSTLVESIRYALNLPIKDKERKKEVDTFCKGTLHNAKVTLNVVSKAQNGNSYTISRRYGENPVVYNQNGAPSNLSPADILPDVEIFGQNEIARLERSESEKLALVQRFLPRDEKANNTMKEIKNELKENREAMIDVVTRFDKLTAQIAQEPKLQEKKKQYEEWGIADKLKNAGLVDKEARIQNKIKERLDSAEKWLGDYAYVLDLDFLSPEKISDLPNKATLMGIREILVNLQLSMSYLVKDGRKKIGGAKILYAKQQEIWNLSIEKIKTQLDDAIAHLPESAGKTGKELGNSYSELVKKAGLIEGLKEPHQACGERKAALESARKELTERYRSLAFDRFASMERQVKKLNKLMANKIRISIDGGKDLTELKNFLLDIDGVGKSKIEWLDRMEDIPDLREWSDWIRDHNRQGFMDKYGSIGLSGGTVDKILGLDLDARLRLSEIELADKVVIKLNVARDQTAPVFVPLERLSTGQKCTAILNLILLNRDDPLIIDQPEDNLDNAFIAERIVNDLRQLKTKRQFILASHNANIPVFGDAELIVALESNNDSGSIGEQGSIDKQEIKKRAASILEGGDAAFMIRKDKYGF